MPLNHTFQRSEKTNICYNKYESSSFLVVVMKHSLSQSGSISHLNRNPPLGSRPQSQSGASKRHRICSHIQSIACLQHCRDIKKKVRGQSWVKSRPTSMTMCITKTNNKSALTFHCAFPKAHRTSHQPNSLA